MRIVITGRDSKRVIETCALDFESGIVLASDFLSAVDLEKNGLLLERCAYTSVDEGRMAVKPPIELLSPDELRDVDEIEADGLLFALREDEALTPCIGGQIYDDDDTLSLPLFSGIRIYYKSGSYESICKTTLHYPDGNLVEDDLVEWSDIEKRGVRWDRGVWTTGDAGLMSLPGSPITVLAPDDLAAVEAGAFEGQVLYPRIAESDGEKEDEIAHEDRRERIEEA